MKITAASTLSLALALTLVGGGAALVLAQPAAPAAAAPAAPAPQGLFKDLQVLPKNISKAELRGIMKAQSKALGVDCDFCHNQPNMAEDTKHKIIGRAMMKMTDEMNKQYPDLHKKVTCFTCHRGKAEPTAK